MAGVIDICYDVFVLTMSISSLALVTNPPNSTALHAHTVVLDFCIFGASNFSLTNEGNVILRVFIFHVYNLICENKSLAKISAYSVLYTNIKGSQLAKNK